TPPTPFDTLSLHDALPIYPGHQSRNVVLGKPSDALKREYQIIRDIYGKTLERCQPGARAGDIFTFVEQEFKKQNWEYKPMLVGRSEEHTSELQSRFDLVCR